MGFKIGFASGAAFGFWVATKLTPEQREAVQAQFGNCAARFRDESRAAKVGSSLATSTAEVVDAAAARATKAIDDVAHRVSHLVEPRGAGSTVEQESA